MMISPESYIKKFENCSVEELKKEKGNLCQMIVEAERSARHPEDSLGVISPSDDTRASVYKDYLAELNKLINSYEENKYNGYIKYFKINEISDDEYINFLKTREKSDLYLINKELCDDIEFLNEGIEKELSMRPLLEKSYNQKKRLSSIVKNYIREMKD